MQLNSILINPLQLFVTFFFPVTIVSAQPTPFGTGKPEWVQQFMKNELCVVWLGKAGYDSTVKKAFDKYWKVSSKTSFITKNEAEDMMSDKTKSFMFTKEINWYSNNGPSGRLMSKCGMVVINGGKKKLKKYDFRLDAVITVAFDRLGFERDLEGATYRISLTIEALNNALLHTPAGKEGLKDMKDKILLINENLVNKGNKYNWTIDPAGIKSYQYKYELASAEKIRELVDARDNRYALLVPILAEGNHHAEIYDVGGKGVIFYPISGTVFSNPWFKAKHFVELSSLVAAAK